MIGDFQWVTTTKGRLTTAQKLHMVPPMICWFGRYLWGLTHLALNWVPPDSSFDVSALPRPPGLLSNETDAVCAALPPHLRGHVYRTWIIGSALAAIERRTVLDPELFYCAALLHDYGLTQLSATGFDFTHASATMAAQCAANAGIGSARTQTLVDAICLHASIGLHVSTSPLGYYVQWGSMSDLAGLRRWRLGRRNLAVINVSNQRNRAACDFVVGLVRQEAKSVPDGRFALYAHFGMPLIMKLAPLSP